MIRVQPGDKIGFEEERNSYTVRAVSTDGRWVVCTKQFAALDTVLYAVVDFQEQLRGRDNYGGLGYETRAQCQRAVEMFESGEAEHSRRHQPIPLRINRWTRPVAVPAEQEGGDRG